ncbi:colicin import membrane protein [Oxalobacteraceae bacterium GrIS 1.11]
MKAIYATMLALTVAAGAAAQEPAVPQAVPEVRGTHSVEEVDATLAYAQQQRDAAEALFAASEKICYTKFFVNHCLDKAKEKRRAELASLRIIEGEASHFKRADSVDKRDRALVEQQEKSTLDAAGRLTTAPKTVPPEVPPKSTSGKTVAQRDAEHQAKLQKQAAQETADVSKRAANVAAFEAKQRESLERQRKVLAKQAEKDEKARVDAAAAKAKDAAQAPAKVQ